MGYSEHKHSGGTRTDFWPDDTPTEFYLDTSMTYSIADLIEKIKAKFGADVNLDDVTIEAEKIHTHAIYYDLYDSSDYTNFLHITWNNPNPEENKT